jgi:CheY-like chemotaxis protein
MTNSRPPRPGHILLVDDDQLFVQTFSAWLQRRGYALVSRRNGQEALEYLRTHRGAVRVVVLDLHMPVMDGFAFLDERASDPQLGNVPVIVLTGITVDPRKLATYRVHKVLAKPVGADQLLRAIEPYWPLP